MTRVSAVLRPPHERTFNAWGVPVLMVLGFCVFLALHGAGWRP